MSLLCNRINRFITFKPQYINSHFKRFYSTQNFYPTIYQLSTGYNSYSITNTINSNTVGVAIIRISGPKSLDILAHLNPKYKKHQIKSRYATLLSLYHPNTLKKIDSNVLALYFESPNSYTGENIIELHVHGNPLIVNEIFDILDHYNPSYVRRAEAGEFTRRAFENNKLDLTQIEGLSDLLTSTTSIQKEIALHSLDGHLTLKYNQWRDEILTYLAHIEAIIDFNEDEIDIQEDIIYNNILPKIDLLQKTISKYIHNGNSGEIIKNGIPITILGTPNVGKSTLLNNLAQRNVAIVSNIPGTTRDALEIDLDLHGYPIKLIDTAGIRNTNDNIEELGINLAKKTTRFINYYDYD